MSKTNLNVINHWVLARAMKLRTFFKEFAGEYLHIKEGCELVEVDYPFKISREDYKEVENPSFKFLWALRNYWKTYVVPTVLRRNCSGITSAN
jgi:hypothetical protein